MSHKHSSSFKLILLLSLLLAGILPVVATAATVTDTIELETDQGKLRLADLKGQVVYLDFWASWCGPCRKSFPWLHDMQQEFAAKGFRIVAVNLDKQRRAAEKFLKKYPANFTIAFDPEGQIASQFKVSGMPSSFLIDRQGNIVSSHVGFLEKKAPELKQRIRALLNKKPGAI